MTKPDKSVDESAGEDLVIADVEDTMTEEEREEATAAAVERENEQAAFMVAEDQKRSSERRDGLIVESTVASLSLLDREDRVDAAKKLFEADEISRDQLDAIAERLVGDGG